MPIKQDVLQNGIQDGPVISLLSQEFAKYSEASLTKSFMANSGPFCKLHAYVEHSSHTQFSDTPYWVQNPLLLKALRLSGQKSINKTIIDSVVRFMKNPSEFGPAHVDDLENLMHLQWCTGNSNKQKDYR